ncbi:MAG: PKD domain-containing protein [Sphingobacteriaceae bacterium]|nr:PKD domain-containing protein [Sphingobacteriaceae bacterium]
MKTHVYITALLGVFLRASMVAQAPVLESASNQIPFNHAYWNTYADKLHLNANDKKEFMDAHSRIHAQTLSNPSPSGQKEIPNNQLNLMAGPCVNIDFESGNINGWTGTSGYHPLFNPIGCCPTPNGQQLVMAGGVDPVGGFPAIAPGGNFSLRLGNNVNGGEADRIEQTFMVSAGNANFTYKYAVVFQDPGHTVAQQPSFQIEMRDSLGNQIPCTFYNVAAGQGIPGFLNSQNTPGAIYKPWTNVMVDLSNYIGQNVTIRFTTYDCALGGHYGYAYIDGTCQAFITGSSDSVCVGATKNFCAPTGLGSYTWNGPGITNVTGQCVNVNAAGIYTCNTTLVTGCTGPQFTYTLYNYPNPVPSFTNSSLNACALQHTFASTSTISSGSITNLNWNFGNGNTSQLGNPIFTFPSAGNHTVQLTATSNHSCSTSVIQTIQILTNPVANFSVNNVCQNAPVNFTNNSYVQNGSITAYNWQFGNGLTSQLNNPVQIYNASGNFSISLTVVSSNGCSATALGNVTIHPLPNVNFSAPNSCFGNNTQYTNNSSISSGNISSYVWDFENDGLSNSFQVNPTFGFPNPGSYTTVLTAVSNFNCVNSYSTQVNVYAVPTSSFSSSEVCFGNKTKFTNLSTMQPGGQIISYAWNLGNGTFLGESNPQHQFNAPGTYTVVLYVLANNGCNSSYTSAVTVNAVPKAVFYATHACENQATQFSNSCTISNGTIVKYRWDFETDGIWDDTTTVNPSHFYPNAGAHNAKLQAISDKQCQGELVSFVKVNANPVADFLNTPACLGDNSTFTNTSYSTDGAISSYGWDFNGDNQIDNISKEPTLTYSNNGVYLLKLEVQTVYGCIGTKSKSMYVNAMPQAVFSVPNRSGCPDFCVTFTNTSYISNGKIVNLFWNYGDGTPTEAGTWNPSHCYKTGNYDVSLMLVSDSGCIAKLSKPSYIVVHPQPVAGFVVEPEEIDEDAPMMDVRTQATGADAYQYLINDKNAVYYAPNFHHDFKTVGPNQPVIVQIVKNQFGCVDTMIKGLKFKPAFAIYVPNSFTPNGDGVNDGWFAKGIGVSKFNIQVYDRWGHVVFETNDMDNAWDGRTKNSDGPIKQDVYVWRAVVTDVFNKDHELTGTVALIP